MFTRYRWYVYLDYITNDGTTGQQWLNKEYGEPNIILIMHIVYSFNVNYSYYKILQQNIQNGRDCIFCSFY